MLHNATKILQMEICSELHKSSPRVTADTNLDCNLLTANLRQSTNKYKNNNRL